MDSLTIKIKSRITKNDKKEKSDQVESKCYQDWREK